MKEFKSRKQLAQEVVLVYILLCTIFYSGIAFLILWILELN